MLLPLVFVALGLSASIAVWYCVNRNFSCKILYYRLFKLRGLSQKTMVDEHRWTTGEKTLCGEFKKFMPALEQSAFDNACTYLRKAGDLGRTPLPLWLAGVIVLLIAAEGVGFSFLLAGKAAPDGSADDTRLIGFAIVFVLCILLGWATHAAGHQLHRTSLIRRCRKDYDESQNNVNEDFKTMEVSLSMEQNIDDKNPRYTQIVNRVGDEGSYWTVIGTAVFIGIIAIASTWQRVETLKEDRTRETQGQTISHRGEAEGNPFASGNASAPGLPKEVNESNKAAEKKADDEAADAGTSAAYTAFVTLGVIFIVTQLLGIYAGFHWGFAGKESSKAYTATRGFVSWHEVKERRNAFIEPIEELMVALHSKFKGGNSKPAKHTFRQYLQMIASGETLSAWPETPQLRPEPIAPHYEPKATVLENPSRSLPDQSIAGIQLSDHLADLDARASKAEKEAYVLGLSQSDRNKVIAAIKKRKDDEASVRKEVEGLF